MSYSSNLHAFEADTTTCKTPSSVCTMLSPSKEPVYILSESALLDAIKTGKLPSVQGLPQRPQTIALRPDGGHLDALQHRIVTEATHAGVFATSNALESNDRLATVEHPNMGNVTLAEQHTIYPQGLKTSTNRRARRAACEHCYQSRKRCEGQQPCSRCTRMRLQCAPRGQRPCESRTTQLKEQPTLYDPLNFSLEIAGRCTSQPSGAAYLQGAQNNVHPGVSQFDCSPAWSPGMNWYDGAACDTLQAASFWQQSPSTSNVRTEDIATHPTFGYAPGGYVKRPS